MMGPLIVSAALNLKSKLTSSVPPPPPRPRISCSSPSSPYIKGQILRFGTALRDCHKINVRCSSSTGPGGPASGDPDSKSVLDAFFLGKALAEALNERVKSAVGEFLSTIGRLQAEQQKQVQDFQGGRCSTAVPMLKFDNRSRYS